MNMTLRSNIYPVSPSTKQLIIRDIGKYGGNSGVNKFFHLMNVITHLTQHLGEEIVITEVNKKLNELKEFEERTKEKTIYSHVKSWEQINERFKALRPRLDEIQLIYDNIRDKKLSKEGQDTSAKVNYKRLARKISPYQIEIYFMFNLLMKISTLQKETISPEAFKSQEYDMFKKPTFKKASDIKEEN